MEDEEDGAEISSTVALAVDWLCTYVCTVPCVDWLNGDGMGWDWTDGSSGTAARLNCHSTVQYSRQLCIEIKYGWGKDVQYNCTSFFVPWESGAWRGGSVERWRAFQHSIKYSTLWYGMEKMKIPMITRRVAFTTCRFCYPLLCSMTLHEKEGI